MGHDCVVYTDHKPLVHLKSFRDLVNERFRAGLFKARLS